MSRLLPQPTETSGPYWSACNDGKLVLQRCQSCGETQFYPRALCASCLSDRLDWIEASGRGNVYSYTIVHRALMPGFVDDVPYVIAMIQLDEGVRLISQLVNCNPNRVFVGMPAAVVFTQCSDEIALPYFQPIVDNAQDA